MSRTVNSQRAQEGPRGVRLWNWRSGFTLVELLVVIAIVGVLISLLMPAVQSCREAARRAECVSNLRELAIAAQAYHGCQGSFPLPRTSTTDPWGHLVRLLPFVDQSVVFRSLDLTKPVTDPVNAKVAALALRFLLCPSDTDQLASSTDPATLPGWWRNNYRGNAGNDNGEIASDGTENNNGVFVTGRRVNVDGISDGISNTALFCEALRGDGSDNVISKPGDWFVISPASHSRQDIYAALQALTPSSGSGTQVSLAGRTFTSGDYLDTRYNHIMPPNGPSGVVSSGGDLISAVNNGAQATTASSRHPHGVNLALVDGSVRFVEETVSPDVWWALGSINGGEATYEDY